MTTHTKQSLDIATFAGGCFWCIEATFKALPGVFTVISGYTGGTTNNPTYEEVCSHATGHLEAVEIRFDPSKISYKELLTIFWRNIDPTDADGQFADRGSSYKTAIFYHNAKQRELADQSKKELRESGKFKKPIVTKIRQAMFFYKAEDYHQDFYKTNPLRYNAYKNASGRTEFVKNIWGNNGNKL